MQQRYAALKEQCALLCAGVGCAVLAWAFWRYAGAEGWGILYLVIVIGLVLDNRRLRARLRAYQGPN